MKMASNTDSQPINPPDPQQETGESTNHSPRRTPKIWKRLFCIPIGYNDLLEFVQCDNRTGFGQVRSYEIKCPKPTTKKRSEHLQEVYDKFGRAAYPTSSAVQFFLEELVILIAESRGFRQPFSRTFERKTRSGIVKRRISYDMYEMGHAQLASLTVTRLNEEDVELSQITKQVDRRSMIQAMDQHKDLIHAISRLVSEAGCVELRDHLVKIALWMLQYHVERCRNELIAHLQPHGQEALTQAVLDKCDEMEEEFQWFLKVFRPSNEFKPGFRKLWLQKGARRNLESGPGMLSLPELQDKTMKPLVYFYLDYFKAFDMRPRTVTMPYELGSAIEDGINNGRYKTTLTG